MKKNIFLAVLLLTSFLVHAQAPTAQFTAPVLSACEGVPLNFTNQSTPGGSPISGYAWDFGDGNSSTDMNPSHAFTNAGTYTITLVTSGSNGQADAEVKTNYITIFPTPDAIFTTSGNGCTVPFGVTFTNGSTSGNDISYAWNFGNGQTSSSKNPPVITYAAAGNYTATLTVTNTTTGCTATISQNIVVSNYAAGINAPASACVGTQVSITDNSTVGANQWIWNLGNGETVITQNTSATYSTPGTYTIKLTSKNSGSGCQAVATHQIIIHPSPTASFTANPVVSCAPATVTFTNTSPPGTSFHWDFGDGQTATGQNPSPHVYTTEGIYSVTLSMTDVNGCKDTLTITDMIDLKPLEVDFSANVQEGCALLTVQFTDLSTSPNTTSSPIVSWLWTFGDGTTFNGQTPPPHVYDLGVYDVTLTVTTQTGCVETHEMSEYIKVGYVQQADFSVSPLTACARTDVFFTNHSIIGIPHDPADVKYFWDFNDGTSVLENPSHQFTSDTGYFDVTLIVDYRGCKDTMVIENAVYIIAPLSLFSPNRTLFCNPTSLPVSVQLTDASKYGLISDDVYMTWHFGDGTTAVFDDADVDDSDKGSTSHTYNNYGSYAVKQVILNHTTGCADSTTQYIHVSQLNADFVLSNDSVCKLSSVSAGNSSVSTHQMTSWYYNAPGATVQFLNSTPNVAYSYLVAGNYEIRMIGSNSVGCIDTAFKSVTVLEFPKAEFTTNPLAGCVPFTPVFVNQSHPQGNGAPVGTFVWTFLDDNTTQSTPNLSTTVSHSYLTEDTFDITLVATDYFGCVSAPDTLTIITTKPVASFLLDSVVCDLEVFSTVNESIGSEPMTYEWFSDGLTNPSIGTDATLEHFYDENSSENYTHLSHNIWLIATDRNGCKDTVMQSVDVSLPVAGIDYTLSGANINTDGTFNCPPVFAVFVDSSESYGEITHWDWNFGDGKHSILQNPNNTYVFSGTYSTSLTITDEFGCTSDTTLLNYLSIGGPSADPSWSLSPGESCSQNIIFNMTNMSSVSEIIWTTGDGQTVYDSTHFVHVYPNNMTFNPTVMIIDSLGCEIIYPLPEINIPDSEMDALFVSNTHEISLEGQFIFDDQSVSNHPIVSWQWDFGDGNVITNPTGASVTYTYPTVGSRVITLIITDINGCQDQYQITVNVIGDFDIPNVFTPNGNGKNDQFTLMHDMFKSYEIIIVNRWGNVVEHKENHTGILLWDGRNKGGEECVDGVYFYKLIGTLFDGNILEKSGFVTLIRTE